MGEKGRRFCTDAILVSLVVLIAVFLVRKCFFLLLPVGMGYLFSEAVRSSFRKLRPVSGPVRRVLIVLVLMILFAFLFLILVLAAERALAALRALADGLTGTAERVGPWLREAAEGIDAWLSGALRRDAGWRVADLIPDLFGQAAQFLAQKLPDLIAAVAGGMPSLLLSLILFLFCGYFFSCGWEQTRAVFYRLCPEEYRGTVLARKRAFLAALKKIIGAYGLLFLLTFAELLAGFLILRIPGAVGKALTVALVDALPVFGCGTALVPWGAVLILTGETGRGAGLLILYLVILVVRQFAEPRIVGRSIGLHPVASLILMLGGLKLFGVWGMILLPLIAACLWDGEKAGAA